MYCSNMSSALTQAQLGIAAAIIVGTWNTVSKLGIALRNL